MSVIWPFGTDADREHPLTALRIAVTDSHPGWYYLVSFDRESEAQPTEVEAAMLASYLEEYKTRWYGPPNRGFRVRMEARPLDVDGGANGVIFHKWGEDDWGFRRQSCNSGWLWSAPSPNLRAEYGGEARSLLALMDHMHTLGDHVYQPWTDWKRAHPEVFGT